MAPADAEKCLRNIARLVGPGGYLFVSGVDLEVRTKVALDLGWKPVAELMAEIHDGDPSVRADWPLQWWGLEPLDRRRPIGRPVMLRCFGLLVRNANDLRSSVIMQKSLKIRVRTHYFFALTIRS